MTFKKSSNIRFWVTHDITKLVEKVLKSKLLFVFFIFKMQNFRLTQLFPWNIYSKKILKFLAERELIFHLKFHIFCRNFGSHFLPFLFLSHILTSFIQERIIYVYRLHSSSQYIQVNLWFECWTIAKNSYFKERYDFHFKIFLFLPFP